MAATAAIATLGAQAMYNPVGRTPQDDAKAMTPQYTRHAKVTSPATTWTLCVDEPKNVRVPKASGANGDKNAIRCQGAWDFPIITTVAKLPLHVDESDEVLSCCWLPTAPLCFRAISTSLAVVSVDDVLSFRDDPVVPSGTAGMSLA